MHPLLSPSHTFLGAAVLHPTRQTAGHLNARHHDTTGRLTGFPRRHQTARLTSFSAPRRQPLGPLFNIRLDLASLGNLAITADRASLARCRSYARLNLSVPAHAANRKIRGGDGVGARPHRPLPPTARAARHVLGPQAKHLGLLGRLGPDAARPVQSTQKTLHKRWPGNRARGEKQRKSYTIQHIRRKCLFWLPTLPGRNDLACTHTHTRGRDGGVSCHSSVRPSPFFPFDPRLR